MHKHFSTAYSLTIFDDDPHAIIRLKIASQVYLGMLHCADLQDIKATCIDIIQKLLNGQDYAESLAYLLDDAWHLETPLEVESTDISSITSSASLDGILFYSNAVELMFCERGHEDDNRSYAIGQLALSEWKLPEYAKEIREIRHLLAAGDCTQKQMNDLRRKLWYKINKDS